MLKLRRCTAAAAAATLSIWSACLLFATAQGGIGLPPPEAPPTERDFTSEKVYEPHLISNIVPPDPPVFPGGPWATIFGIYEVETDNWEAMKVRLTQRLAVSLENISPDHLSLIYVEKLAEGKRCSADLLQCKGLGKLMTIREADPRNCTGKGDLSDKLTHLSEWMPSWTDKDDLEYQVWNTYMCISESNTSLLKYPFILNNTYITGTRDIKNTKVYTSAASNLTLHIVGVIPVPWAKFFNAKFQMDGEIPLPERQPEVIDELATHTADLNISITIFGIRDLKLDGVNPPYGLATQMKTCPQPTLSVKGCFRMDHIFYEHPRMTYYKLKYRVLWNRHIFAEVASDQPYPYGEFNVSRGPWPSFEMFADPHSKFIGPWKLFIFPQKEWTHQRDCQAGVGCSLIPLAPSPRYMHSASLYRTWGFEQDAWKFLCNQQGGCGINCLTDLTCLGGDQYWDTNFFFRSEEFKNDDGEVEPFLSLDNIDCPSDCCRDRRMCLRKYDVLGYEVPFDAAQMLVFGGKTYAHVKDQDGKLIYHSCEGETVQLSLVENKQWRSCMEIVTNELWRYDISRGKWEYIKTDSALSPTTGKPMGWPIARFGHASTVVKTVENNEGFTRMWLYMYGGLGPQCEGGVCNDVWKYEIPWAAQAYYPKFPDGAWDRGNQWYRLKDCPFGARYGHEMVTTTAMEYIYIFGGQSIGEYYDTLYRYRISTDMWEDLSPFGRISLTRLMYNYMEQPLQFPVDPELFDPAIDVDCRLAFGSTKRIWAHCAVCPECRLSVGRSGSGAKEARLPAPRVGSGMTFFFESDDAADESLLVFGGFRTTWGNDQVKKACVSRTSTTTTTYLWTTTLDDGGFKPIPPGPTTTTRTTETSTSTSTSTTITSTISTITSSSGTSTTGGTTTTSSTTSTTSTSTSTTSTSTTSTTTSMTTTKTTTTTSTHDGMPRCFISSVNESTDSTIFAGAASQSQDQPDCEDQDDPFAANDTSFYFQDTWKYDATVNQWLKIKPLGSGTMPPARRGSRMIARNATSNDTLIIVFGGHVQDEAFGDMWILDLKDGNTAGEWTRIDQFFIGLNPLPVTYHTMLYDNQSDLAIVFGGIHWKPTDLEVTDARRNVDRRCFKEAQELGETWVGPTAKEPWSEDKFLAYITLRCAESQFCCSLAGLKTGEGVSYTGFDIRTARNMPLCLGNVSLVCQTDCDKKAFKPEFYPIMVEGVWTFSPNACQGNCGGHGVCQMSQCTCDVGWYGADCRSQRCPGSACYSHPYTKEQYCIECSQHGRCIAGQCECYPGWGYDDCSAVLCENNCSSTHLETRGICVEDFPVHQCICVGKWSGVMCDTALCLNDCSGRGTCAEGVCQCQKYFHGEDCSMFAFPLNSADAFGNGLEDWDWQGLDNPQKTYGYDDISPLIPEIPLTTPLPL